MFHNNFFDNIYHSLRSLINIMAHLKITINPPEIDPEHPMVTVPDTYGCVSIKYLQMSQKQGRAQDIQ